MDKELRDRTALTSAVSPQDHADAAELAMEAGQLLLDLRAGGLTGTELGREGDRISHAFLVEHIRARHPADRIRSEEDETVSSPSPGVIANEGAVTRAHEERLWVIDPLDGTREYGEPGRVDWAVHVALTVGGVPAVGAVSLPASGRLLSTLDPPSDDRLANANAKINRAFKPRLVVSRTRPPEVAWRVAAAIGASIVRMGSAGAKICSVILGEAHVYVHAGGQYEWDSAAPVAVALAAGLHASRLDGSDLRYGAPDPWLPDLVVCRPELAPAVLGAAEAR